MSHGDVSIGSIASSAGAEAARQHAKLQDQRQQAQSRQQRQHRDDDAHAVIVVSPQSRHSNSSGVSSSSSALDQQHPTTRQQHRHDSSGVVEEDPREWRNVPAVVARSIVRMDHKLSLLLAHQEQLMMGSVVRQQQPSASQQQQQRRVQRAYGGTSSNVSSALSSFAGAASAARQSSSGLSTPPPPLIVPPARGGSNDPARAAGGYEGAARIVITSPEVAAAQQQQTDAHQFQSQLLHHCGPRTICGKGASSSQKQQQQPQSQQRDQQRTQSLLPPSGASSNSTSVLTPSQQQEKQQEKQKQKQSSLFCVTTRHANCTSQMPALDDISLFGVQGPRGLYGTDQQDGATFFAAHRAEFAELEAAVAQQRASSVPSQHQQLHQHESERTWRKSPSPSAVPQQADPLRAGEETSWGERIQAVRKRHQQQPATLPIEESKQQQQQQNDDVVSVASSTCSAAIVLASRPKMPDVIQAVREVEEEGDDDDDDDQKHASEQQPVSVEVPPLHPKTSAALVQNNAADTHNPKVQQQQHQNGDHVLQQRLQRLREIKQRIGRRKEPVASSHSGISFPDHRADGTAAVVVPAPCRWNCERDVSSSNHTFVRCGGGSKTAWPLHHRAEQPARCQTSLDGISAATSMQLVLREALRAEQEARQQAEAERQRQIKAAEAQAASEQELQKKQKQKMQRETIDENEKRIAAAWRQPQQQQVQSPTLGSDDSASLSGGEEALNQRILRSRLTALEQQRLLEQLRNSRWRREPSPLDDILDADAMEQRKQAARDEDRRMKKLKEERALAQTFRSWVFRTTGEISTANSAAVFVPCSVREQDFALARCSSHFPTGTLHHCAEGQGGGGRDALPSSLPQQQRRSYPLLLEPSIPNPRSEAPLQIHPRALNTTMNNNNNNSRFILRWAGFKDAHQRSSFVVVAASPPAQIVPLRVCFFSPRAELRSSRHAGVRTRNGVASWRIDVRVNRELRTALLVRPHEIAHDDADGSGTSCSTTAESRLHRSLLLSSRIDLDVFHGDMLSFELRKVPVDVHSPFQSGAKGKASYDTDLLDIRDILPQEKFVNATPPLTQSSSHLSDGGGANNNKKVVIVTRGDEDEDEDEVSKALAFERDQHRDAALGLVRTPRSRLRSQSVMPSSVSSSDEEHQLQLRQQQHLNSSDEFQNIWFLQFSSRYP